MQARSACKACRVGPRPQRSIHLHQGKQQAAAALAHGQRLLGAAAVVREQVIEPHLQHLGQRCGPHIGTAQAQLGQPYNQMGILLQAPFTLERRLCELPVLPGPIRDFCLRGIALVQLGLGPNDRFFCSQLVLEAYKRAGLPLTDADPRLAAPVDLLHMREGDVPSVKTHQALSYVGHLKLPPESLLQSVATN